MNAIFSSNVAIKGFFDTPKVGITCIFTDRKGKVMFSQVFVCSQSASWLLVHCSSLLPAQSVRVPLESFLVVL